MDIARIENEVFGSEVNTALNMLYGRETFGVSYQDVAFAIMQAASVSEAQFDVLSEVQIDVLNEDEKKRRTQSLFDLYDSSVNVFLELYREDLIIRNYRSGIKTTISRVSIDSRS